MARAAQTDAAAVAARAVNADARQDACHAQGPYVLASNLDPLGANSVMSGEQLTDAALNEFDREPIIATALFMARSGVDLFKRWRNDAWDVTMPVAKRACCALLSGVSIAPLCSLGLRFG